MKQKGNAHVEEHVEKHVKKKIMFKVRDNQKMLQWMKMYNELKWARQANLEGMFNMQWTTLRKGLLQDFLQTWEVTNDGRILTHPQTP